MARLHARRKGKSHSSRPTYSGAPSWVTYSSEEINSLIVKLAKEGLGSSEIGVKLRDEYAIPLVRSITGKSILQAFRENNLAPAIPEDLRQLVDQANKLRNHLATYKSDRKSVRSMELKEAKIHRLAKYYKKLRLLPPDWSYKSVVAQLT